MGDHLYESVSRNGLPHHNDHNNGHYPSGFDTSKYREQPSNPNFAISITRRNKTNIENREFFDPFHSRTDSMQAINDDNDSRPSSPYKMTPPIGVDEYGDVAGQYFRDIVMQRSPSRKATSRKRIPKKKTDSHALIFQKTAVLPQLKTSKPVWTAIQSQHHQYKPYASNGLRDTRESLTSENLEESASRVLSMLGGDSIASSDAGSAALGQPLSGVPVPENVRMILYRYQSLLLSGSTDSLKVSENGGDGLPVTIVHDCQFQDLKNCIIKFVFGEHKITKHQFRFIFDNIKLWYFDLSCGQWARLLSKKDWDHVKLISLCSPHAIKLMFDDEVCLEYFADKNSRKEIGHESVIGGASKPPYSGPPRLSLLDGSRQQSTLAKTSSKQEEMAEMLEQRLLLSRRF